MVKENFKAFSISSWPRATDANVLRRIADGCIKPESSVRIRRVAVGARGIAALVVVLVPLQIVGNILYRLLS